MDQGAGNPLTRLGEGGAALPGDPPGARDPAGGVRAACVGRDPCEQDGDAGVGKTALVQQFLAHGLVLVLEDLQWSDASTVEFLAYVARRTDRLRLLVLGTSTGPPRSSPVGIRCGRRCRNWWRTGCVRRCGWNC